MSKGLKIGGMLLLAVLLVAALGGIVLAQGPRGRTDGVRDLAGTGIGSAWGFVDENGDGINDRYQVDPQFVDENGDGICDLCGMTGQASATFIDENGDGVCDYYSGGQYSQQQMGTRGRWAAGW